VSVTRVGERQYRAPRHGKLKFTRIDTVAAACSFCGVRLILFLTLLIGSVTYALLRGGKPERAAAIVFLLMAIGDPFVHEFTPPTYTILDPGHFVIDLLAWCALLAIALRAKRFWPLWISSLQTISLIAHVTKLLDYSIHPTVYAIMQVSSSYPLLIILVIGTLNHQRRLRGSGSDPHWRTY
jgi:hypothetical protein